MPVLRSTGLLALASLLTAAAHAAVPYTPVPVSGLPVVGPGMSAPDGVYGKEHSHDFDFSTVGPTADPQQVIAWDGIGGTADGVDFSFTRPDWKEDQQVDAIANHRDALFDETLRDESHLIFSHDDLIAAHMPGGGMGLVPVPSGGPVILSNGNKIGGAGEVSVEMSGMFGPPSMQGLWASLPEVNAMPLPHDVDGLEVWGPEPRKIEEPDAPVIGDSDRYSLDVDFPSGVSVWNASGSAYLSHPEIVMAVESLLGPIPPSAFSLRDEQQGRNAINLDALMVSDILGHPERFDREPSDLGDPTTHGEELVDQNGGPIEPFGLDGEMRGDSIIFSIRQIIDPADPDGYYSTGSELFVLDTFKGASFLHHGGHVWDHGFALSELMLAGGPDGEDPPFRGVIDINAIEAIGEDVISPPIGLPGDFNADGKVDAADYTVWRDNLGTPFPLAGNGDETGSSAGTVDALDYALWRSNYGSMTSPAPTASAAAAPEPAAAALTLLGLAGALARRRRR
ncbi:hypothetical protein KOR34_41300 [Posidoniimonas corsicana]|uniref:PEP-CTERM protein-sorting domain-containing protein n=1 Tax=Posidoniimonas corsicana TaxID=1938618 RepID=A0A5C5V3N6_9BACT|nr:PEP-CTERM sorting domain-containing protein [Posidoniimonas corsicana]TWT32367.1 hypothetical protein KOR34_41300 [Posidoniimonas corsicana]